MSKIKLVLRPDEFTSFTSYYLEDFWRESFDIEFYDVSKTYDKKRTLFAVRWMSVDGDDTWPVLMRDQGYKIVVDNLWEKITNRSDFYWIEHKYFMQWNESLWWIALGYDTYKPNKQINYKALLQLRLEKPERNQIINCLDDELPKILWSYVAKNKRLPHDTDDPNLGQRYMHPSWYDETYFSIVAETSQTLPLYVSEKSYKPIAYYHPFVIIGAAGTLAFLRESGFETFDNMFDESYDKIENFKDRLKIIKSNIKNIDTRSSYDRITQDKLNHNHEHFFNETHIKNCMRREIVQPLIDYAET